MDTLHSVILVTAASLMVFSGLGFSQPDSEVVKVVEKNRTTELMTGSVFEVHFASGGTEKYTYVTHNEEYCSENPDSSGCPPEDFPDKPPLMQKYSFNRTGEEPTTYRPQESICIEEVYIRCEGFNRAKIVFSELIT